MTLTSMATIIFGPAYSKASFVPDDGSTTFDIDTHEGGVRVVTEKTE